MITIMKWSLLLFPVFALSALLNTLNASESDDKKTIEVIEITADRPNSYSAKYVQAGTFFNANVLDTALTTNIITKELLDAQLASSLADTIRNTAGVSAAQINTTIYSNLNIRGIRLDPTTNYRLNGILPIANYVQTPMENKYRVEVLKGAAGLYYGFGSPAGIVNLVTERAYQDQIAGSLFANQHGTYGASLDISKMFDDAGVRVNLVAADEEIGIERTSGERQFASVGYHFDINDKLRFEFDGEYIARDITEPTQYYLLANQDGSLSLPPLLDTDINHGAEWFKAETTAHNLLGKLSYAITPNLHINMSLGRAYADTTRRYSAFFGYDIETGSDGLVSLSTFPNTEYENNIADVKLTSSFTLLGTYNQWVMGASRRENESIIADRVRQGKWAQNLYHPINIAKLPTPPRSIKNTIEKTDIGYFLNLKTHFNEQWQTTLGYRYADYKNTSDFAQYDDTEDTLSGSVIYKPQPNFAFYTSYIEGLEEGGIAQGIAKNAGEVLPAALSEQWEYGVKFETSQQLLLTLAYFDIDRASAFIHPETEFFVQDGRANYAGVELSASGGITEGWSVYTTASYIDAEQQKSSSAQLNGNAIENTPKTTASIFTTYQLNSVQGLSLSLGAYYTGSRYVDALNSASANAYTLFDAGINYQLNLRNHDVAISLYVQNIADKAYWAATGSRLLAQGHPRTIKFELKTAF